MKIHRFGLHPIFPWQFDSKTHLPGGSFSVAHQFLRCVLHQLAPNGVFVQIFATNAPQIQRRQFFKSIVQGLINFPELNPTCPIQLLLESLNSKKTLPFETLPITFRNLTEYINFLPVESINLGSWTPSIQGIEPLFRRLVLFLGNFEDLECLLDVMVSVLRIPNLPKGCLEPFSKIVSHAIQNINVKHKVLHDLCYNNSRAFAKVIIFKFLMTFDQNLLSKIYFLGTRSNAIDSSSCF